MKFSIINYVSHKIGHTLKIINDADHVHCILKDPSTEYWPKLSADISADMLTDTRSSVGRVSIDMSVAYRPICLDRVYSTGQM